MAALSSQPIRPGISQRATREDESRSSEPRPLRWSKAQYHQMDEVGLFEGKRVELIEGEIIEMAPLSPPHFVTTGLVGNYCRHIFSEGYIVTDGYPISILEESEPQPDIGVIRGDWRDFKTVLPTEKTTVLAIEVSVTTLTYDLNQKAALYARAQIPEYWVLDVSERKLHLHRQPDALSGRYNLVQILDETQNVAPLEKPDAEIRIAEMLP